MLINNSPKSFNFPCYFTKNGQILIFLILIHNYFFFPCFLINPNFNKMRLIHRLIVFTNKRGIKKHCICNFFLSICLMNMPKHMYQWFNLINFLHKLFTPHMCPIINLIQYSIWWSMSYNNIRILLYYWHENFTLWLFIHKTPLKEF